ncbi:MAG: hypothetical protein A2161_14775 [Candidatus Schekmanbacteria bacterium RBG_13_48_7]|uniref:Uncharacterized protein n=1 Tax=Candidatus Schekmanbacteria bacterium RBG_13_48_7 TaxID=1817878 RepID=A0A1F7S513_9BACT|nr:MAG: hypothetical protein A2161_14775 [Candidatus Schekmanbacteria bacterium RBG_13_48_7]
MLFSLFLVILHFDIFSQHTSKNNYTGTWLTTTSWSPTWATPTTSISGYNITIYGYITVNGSLNFSGSGGDLFVNDTLVVQGDLSFGSNNNLTVYTGGVLIVRGNLTAGNKTDILANSYIVITGNFTASGSQTTFSSPISPSSVFIGGTVEPVDGNVTDCPGAPGYITNCNYGNIDQDLQNDPISSFVNTTCLVVPTAYNVTGGGSYCEDGSGVEVGLSSSQSGVHYHLKIGGVDTDSPVDGTGSAISFGNQATAGTYTVRAFDTTTFCASTMTGNITVTVNTLPPTTLIYHELEGN